MFATMIGSMSPVHKANHGKFATTSLLSFIASSRGLFHEESRVPKVHNRDGFILNMYKLMKKSSYDFSKLTSSGHVIKAKLYGLNNTKNMMQG